MRVLFVIVFLVCTNILVAQTVYAPRSSFSIDYEKLIEAPGGNFIGAVYQNDHVSGTNWNKFRKKITISLYDKNFNLVSSKPLLDGTNQFSAFHSSLIQSNDKIFLAYIEPGKGNKISDFKVIKIDNKTLQESAPQVVVSESDIDEKVKFFWGENKIFTRSSPSTKKHLVYIDNSDDEFFLASLDENMVVKWKNKISLPGYKQKEIQSIIVDDAGKVYLSCLNKKNIATIFTIDNGEISLSKQFSIESATVFNLQIENSKIVDELYIGGAIGTESDNASVLFKGTIKKNNLSIVDMDKLVINDTILRLLDKNGLAYEKKKKAGIIPFFISIKLFPLKDSEPLLLIECRRNIYAEKRTYGVAASLIIANFNTNVKEQFVHIPRYAVLPSEHEEYEYLTNVCNDKLNIVYIDNEANFNKTANEDYKVLNGTKNAAFFIVTIDNQNKFKQKLLSMSSTNFYLNVNKAFIESCK